MSAPDLSPFVRATELSPLGEFTPEQQATVDRFGIHEPEADDSEWCVHVIGPDDVLPARDLLDAVRQAHAINAAAVDPGGYYGDASEARPFMTLAWAVPSRREWV